MDARAWTHSHTSLSHRPIQRRRLPYRRCRASDRVQTVGEVGPLDRAGRDRDTDRGGGRLLERIEVADVCASERVGRPPRQERRDERISGPYRVDDIDRGDGDEAFGLRREHRHGRRAIGHQPRQ